MSDLMSQEELDRLLNSGDFLKEQPEELPEEEKDDDGKTEINQRKLELILDVPVKSRVVVGKTTRKLKDLLDLKPGMIIETSNEVTKHVELMVNDNVIALGEVVVVGENYGLCVKQIINPVERMRKLK